MANNDIGIRLTAEDRTKAAFASVRNSLKSLKGDSISLQSTFSSLLPALRLGGLAAFAKSGIDAADALNDLSDRTGVAVETLSGLQLVAAQSDTSMEALGKGINKLSIFMAENSEEAKKLGLTASDPAEAFAQLADVLGEAATVQDRNAIANKVLGKSYADLLPALVQGGDALRQQIADGQKAAGVTTEQAKAAAKFNDELDKLKLQLRGVGINVGQFFIPVIKGIVFFAKSAGIAVGHLAANMGALVDLIKTRDLGAFKARIAENRALAEQMRIEVVSELEGIGKAEIKPPKLGKLTSESIFGTTKISKTKTDTAAKQEAAAQLKALEALEKARAEATAQGLEDTLTARRERLEQSRAAELIDEGTFIRAKAALDEEGLRNELSALQAQQDKLRAASVDKGAKGSERTQALADLALVEARIQTASDKILNLNQAATADLAALAAAKLKSQTEFIDGLEKEAFLSSLSNDERETALLLLEAEKLGIADVNDLLELQGRIRANANAAKAADELKRQQDDLYASVQEGVQQAFADGLNAVATGEGGFQGALKNLVDTIRNALSNAIAGSLTDEFLGLLGGKSGVLNIAGSLGFGGKKDGSTPASAIYVQDVSAGAVGGAGGSSGVGGLFSGIGDVLSGIFSQLKAALTSLVSGIGSALGGGGGQNLFGSIASLFGFAEGGWTGPGGKFQPAGIVHADEFVFDKTSTNRIGVNVLENLRRIASGRVISSRPRLGYADGGLVNLPGAAAPVVNSSTRVLNYFDMDSAMSDYLKTRSGERAILNIIQRNPGAAGA